MLTGNYEDEILVRIFFWLGIDLAYASYAFEMNHGYVMRWRMQCNMSWWLLYAKCQKLIGICCPSSWGSNMDWCLKLREMSYILVEFTGDWILLRRSSLIWLPSCVELLWMTEKRHGSHQMPQVFSISREERARLTFLTSRTTWGLGNRHECFQMPWVHFIARELHV